MKVIDDLTLKQVVIPSGQSISKDELEVAERALLKLLGSYTDEVLKQNLRNTLQKEIEKISEPEAAFLLDYNLMKPAELYQLIAASQLLCRHLVLHIESSISRRAYKGDPEAIDDLAALHGTTA